MRRSRIRNWIAAALSCAALLLLSLTATAAVQPLQMDQRSEPPISQIIVKFKPAGGALPANASAQAYAMTSARLQALSASAGIPLHYIRPMSNNAQVVSLPYPVTRAQANMIAAQLRQDADVDYAEPDIWMFPASATNPTDPQYGNEWHLAAPTVDLGAADVAPTWNITTGSSSVVIGIVDTGVLNHTDLQANLVGGFASSSGYDFVSTVSAAYSGNIGSNDGDGRDSNPTDPGDWTVADECYSGWLAQNSSWHGTHVAGIIGAVGDNSVGVTGVNQHVKLLMARALGTCGGTTSDIADALTWASGGSVTGVTNNPNPAKVVNMSLGGSGSCGTTMQTAINAAVSMGTTVVVAAGNSNTSVSTTTPANCSNVITVAALGRAGDRAYYSNYDSSTNYIALAAPGGEQSYVNDPNGILSTLDSGATTAANDNSYVYDQGTSMATPVVSGTVGLMLAANSHLYDGTITPSTVPALIKSKLQASVRAFPTGTGRDCTTSTCGAGIIDAAAAVAAVSTPPTANAGSAQSVYVSTTVTLNGSGSTDDGTIVSYHWTQTAGSAVTLSNANAVSPTFTAPATAGTLTFQLQVTDDVGLTSTASVNVTVEMPPVANAGPDQTAPLYSTVTLDGSGSTGANLTYFWGQSSGTHVTLSDVTAVSPTFYVHTMAAPQTLTFVLIVTDTLGHTSTDSVNVTVTP